MNEKSGTKLDVIQNVLDAHGHDSPTETQTYAVSHGALSAGNRLLVADTGNGKTAVAEARVKIAVEEGQRVAYLVPTNQLKSAKASELKEWADFEVLVSGKDNDAYKKGKVVVASFEGYYQMSLNHPAKVSDISLAVLDDFHYMYETYRGFTIEKLITVLKRDNTSIFAMSASVGGAEKLADWMNARLIVSPEDRRISIQERVEDREDGENVRIQVADFIIHNDDISPFLVFNKSRRTAESTAKWVAKRRGWDAGSGGTQSQLGQTESDGQGTEWVARRRVLNELEDIVDAMTEEMEEFAGLLSHGVAYHHAGLPSELKEYVEGLYQDGLIDTLSITTTLGSGYDAPVQTVIVADYTRWSSSGGSEKIGVWEYEQWVGRAGRPGYDHDIGVSVIFAKNQDDISEYLAPRELEPIQSHVKQDELLRKFLLELIVTGSKSLDEIQQYIDRTLWVHESEGEILGVEYDPYDSVQVAATWLADNWFIERMPNGFKSTPLGQVAVNYGFSQFGRYSLIGFRNLYEWIEDQDQLNRTGLTQAICRTQNIKLYSSDKHLMTDEFREELLDYSLDSDDDFAKTTGVLLWFWCQNRDLEDAVKSSGLRAEFTASVARSVHDVMLFLPDIIEVAGDKNLPDWYQTFKLQLDYGVTEGQAQLVNEVDGIGRVRVRNLDRYFDSIDADLRGPETKTKLVDLIERREKTLARDAIKDQVPGFGDVLANRLVDAVED